MFCQNQRNIKDICERSFAIIMLVTIHRVCSFRFVAVVNHVNSHDIATVVYAFFTWRRCYSDTQLVLNFELFFFEIA